MNGRDYIVDTVKRWGAGDPSALIRFSERESRLTPNATGDLKKGGEAYDNAFDEIVKWGNPWAYDRYRWAGSFGLFQMMPAYHLKRWQKNADPHVLYAPRLATVIAARYWNLGVQRGARDFIDMRLWWANPNFLAYKKTNPARYASERAERMNSQWSIIDGEFNPPLSRYDYSAFGTGPQPDQLEKLGKKIEPAQSWVPMLIVAAIVWRAYRAATK